MEIENTLSGDSSLVDPGFDTPPHLPMELARRWFDQAVELGVREPYGMVLCTVDTSGRPSSRVLLVKEVVEDGLVFGGSATSKKGLEMEANNQIAGNFWWRETMQQMRFQGTVIQLPLEQADQVFQHRDEAEACL